MARWIAVTAVSGFASHRASDAIKKKVRGILSSWRQRHGQPKLDEAKGHLFKQLQDHRRPADCRLPPPLPSEGTDWRCRMPLPSATPSYAIARVPVLVNKDLGSIFRKSLHYTGSDSSRRRRRVGSVSPRRSSRTFCAGSGVVTQRRRTWRLG